MKFKQGEQWQEQWHFLAFLPDLKSIPPAHQLCTVIVIVYVPILRWFWLWMVIKWLAINQGVPVGFGDLGVQFLSDEVTISKVLDLVLGSC